jgi:hypothetical protein
MLNSRGFRCALFLLLVACGGAKPEPKLDDMPQQPMDLSPSTGSAAQSGDLSPVLVSPTVAETDVADSIDIFASPDSASLIKEIDRRIAPAKVHDGFMEALTRNISNDTNSFSAAPFDDVSKGAFVLRSGGKNAALVIRKKDSLLVPPVEWMRAVLWFKDVDAATARSFYVQMSVRLATSGRASGIALFGNGNALAIVMEEQRGEDNDIAIAARTQFMKAGTFDAKAWGPTVQTSQGVSNKDGVGHKGLNAKDFLKKLIGSSAPASSPPGGISL